MSFEKNVAIYGPLIVHQSTQVNRSQLPSSCNRTAALSRERKQTFGHLHKNSMVDTSADLAPLQLNWAPQEKESLSVP